MNSEIRKNMITDTMKAIETLRDIGRKKDLEKALNLLYAEVAHGDEEHRKWLKDKFDDFLQNLKVDREGINLNE